MLAGAVSTRRGVSAVLDFQYFDGATPLPELSGL
jgi:hypothetical protein